MGNRTTLLEDVDETDLDITEIVEGMTANRNTSEPRLREETPDRFLFSMSHRPNYPATDGHSTTDNLHNLTLPSANTFRMINSEDRWLKRWPLR